ncbi:hypothetical protein ACS3SW_12455 [Roseobacteraceae bacterium S113]
MADNFKDLLEVARVQYERAQAEMAQIARREQDARHKLEEIGAQFRAASQMPTENLHRMQKLGAQELWAKWMRNKQAQLNRDLATILAQKDDHKTKLRLLLGRFEAIEKLNDQDVKDRRDRINSRAQETLLLQSVTR